MNYTAKYFKDNLPEWKRKKDPVLSRAFYRPLSFYTASICANRGISANAVSYFSTFIGLLACAFFLVNNHYVNIVGALLVNVWLLLDCTDGNLARSVKKQPYGEFADAISSYILVGVLFNVVGYTVFTSGGFFVSQGNAIIFLLGAFASSADSLMRLIYQKYLVVSNQEGISAQVGQDGSGGGKIDKIRIKVEQEVGLGGILPSVLLVCTIFKCLDIVVIIWFLYYTSVFIATTAFLVNKAIKMGKISN